MKNSSLLTALVIASTMVAACGGNTPEPKTAGVNASAQADASTSAPDAANGQPSDNQKDAATDTKPADVQPADAPNAATAQPDSGVPDTAPPSEKPAVIDVVWDGLTTEVLEGQTYSINSDRMLFFYAAAANPDCGNVTVTNLIKRPLAGLCQIGFLPQEQQLKKNEERPASITVGNTTRSFRVKAL